MPRVGFAYDRREPAATLRFVAALAWATMCLYDNIGTLSRPPQIGLPRLPESSWPTPSWPTAEFRPSQSAESPFWIRPTARADTSRFLPNNVKYPYSIQWNLGVQHVFQSDYTAEVRYVGTRGVDLDAQNIIDFQDVATPSHLLPTYLQNPGQATLDGCR